MEKINYCLPFLLVLFGCINEQGQKLIYCIGAYDTSKIVSQAPRIPVVFKPIKKDFQSIVVRDNGSYANSEIRCFMQDSQNNFWFGTNGEGAFMEKGNTIIQFTEKQGLPDNYVWNIQEGKDGRIWLKTHVRSTDTDVICYYDGKGFKAVSTDTSLVYTGTDFWKDNLFEGYFYNGKSLGKIKLPRTSPLKKGSHSRFHYDIYSTCKDKHGNMWFGTCTAGVCKYDGKTFTWINDESLGAPVRSIFEDKKGNIWIGNNGYGLFRYDGKTLTNITKEKKLENPDFVKNFSTKEGTLARVWTITDDKHGSLWVGTIDSGAWKFDGSTFTNYTTKDGLGSDAIWTIYRDRHDELWFGTEGAGVYTFNGKLFKKYPQK